MWNNFKYMSYNFDTYINEFSVENPHYKPHTSSVVSNVTSYHINTLAAKYPERDTS